MQGLRHVEFRQCGIGDCNFRSEFDLAYTRFLVTHLRDAPGALRVVRQVLRPGGSVVVDDIDFAGHFCHPDVPALWRYVEL